MNRYRGKDRPGRIHSPYGPLGTHWAYPPGIAESGVGLVETITGLAMFIFLAMVGAQAIRGAAAHQREAARVQEVTEAMPAGAGHLSAMSGSGSGGNKAERYGAFKDSRGGRQ